VPCRSWLDKQADRRGAAIRPILVFYLCSATAAANASARGQRAAILASPLHELTGFYLAVDCLTPGCNGERTFAIAEPPGWKRDPQRARQGRVPLLGPEARE
jgi:hypothetical protein